MANSSSGGPQKRNSVKAPLLFSAVLAVIAGVTTMIFATGGADKDLRLDLGFTAAGIAFIVSVLICSLLLMTEKPNPDHLSAGSGVNRSSANIPGGAGAVGGTGTSAAAGGTTPDTAAAAFRPEAARSTNPRATESGPTA